MKDDHHVLSINDLQEHQETRTCWCKPAIRTDPQWKGALVVHNSMDGRELVERHGVQ